MNNPNRSNILWTVAGLYLLYLAWGLGKGLMQGDVSGTTFIVSVIGCAAFAVVGVLLLVKTIRSMFSAPDDQPEDTEEEEEVKGDGSQ